MESSQNETAPIPRGGIMRRHIAEAIVGPQRLVILRYLPVRPAFVEPGLRKPRPKRQGTLEGAQCLRIAVELAQRLAQMIPGIRILRVEGHRALAALHRLLQAPAVGKDPALLRPGLCTVWIACQHPLVGLKSLLIASELMASMPLAQERPLFVRLEL